MKWAVPRNHRTLWAPQGVPGTPWDLQPPGTPWDLAPPGTPWDLAHSGTPWNSTMRQYFFSSMGIMCKYTNGILVMFYWQNIDDTSRTTFLNNNNEIKNEFRERRRKVNCLFVSQLFSTSWRFLSNQNV